MKRRRPRNPGAAERDKLRGLPRVGFLANVLAEFERLDADEGTLPEPVPPQPMPTVNLLGLPSELDALLKG